MALWAGGVASGQPHEQGTEVQQAHIFTSHDEEGSTHYFYSISFPQVLGPIGEQMARENVAILDPVFSQERQADSGSAGA